MWTPRVVLHDVYFLLPDHIAAEVLLEAHSALQRHAQIASLIVGAEQILGRVNVIHIPPPATVKRLEERRESYVLEYLIPIHRINKIPHREVGRAWRMLLVGQDHSRRHGNTKFVRQGVVEELVVGAPPEGVVDNDRPIERSVLKISTIERDVV